MNDDRQYDPEVPLERSALQSFGAEEPPADFAAQVAAAVREEHRAPVHRSRWRRSASMVGGVAIAACLALVVAPWFGREHSGSSVISARETINLGSRGLAVAEAGAELVWKVTRSGAAEVKQSAGDVFYRVERSGPFVVRTPAGIVSVTGTCFRVHVSDFEKGENMIRSRDGAAALVGAAVGFAVFIAVYEGKVSISRGDQTLELGAGESGTLDERGARRTPRAANSKTAGTEPSSTQRPSWGDARQAGALLGNVSSRLAAMEQEQRDLEAQKTALERELEELKKQRADTSSWGLAGGPQDWNKVAEGKQRLELRIPCPYRLEPSQRKRLGIRDDEEASIKGAFERVSSAIWERMKPHCAAVPVDQQVADRPDRPWACLFSAMVSAGDQAVQIRAGRKPMPGPGEAIDASLQVMIIATSAGEELEKELSKFFPPQDARRFAYTNGACVGSGQGSPTEP